MTESVLQTAWHDNVMLITLTRPSVSNGLNPELLQAFSKVWAEAAAERCRAVVLTGAGRNFCGGADLAAERFRLNIAR